MQTESDQLHIVTSDHMTSGRILAGRYLGRGSGLFLVAVLLFHLAGQFGYISYSFDTSRPVLYAYLFWAVTMGVAQVLLRGEQGKRALFILPAVLFVVAMVIFPMIFGLVISFSDWNLASLTGRKFNGLDNFRQMAGDPFYWNAMLNMVWYVLAITVEYAIAFGLALLLSSQIRARKF